MDMPEVNKLFGMFPLKYGCYLISLFGLGSGGVGLTGIILYGLVEDSIIAHFVNTQNSDPTLKKLVLMTIGLSSLLLLVANALLFLGGMSSSSGCVGAAKWVIFALCLILILGSIGAPMSCFFLQSTCVIKKISSAAMVLGYIAITIFLELWLYFMVVIYNYEITL